MSDNTPKENSGKKLFFGLFIFPLLIALSMALFLCTVVLLTTEKQTPDTLIAAIKSGAPSKRWQKAFELSNELNQTKGSYNQRAVEKEIISILRDPAVYDEKTRSYMALALARFNTPTSVEALKQSLLDPSEDVKIYSLWSLGSLGAKSALGSVKDLLKSDKPEIKKVAVYVVGVLGDKSDIATVRPFLEDSSVDVRWNAALSLARFGDASSFAILKTMLDREELEGRLRMNEEQVEGVMINSVKGLALIPSADSIKILQSVSRQDKSLKVRQAALEALEHNIKEGK